MKSISDNLISVEEARLALKCMQKCSLSADEALETVDEYIERIRAVSMASLTDYIIENRLTPVQRAAIKCYWFDTQSAEECAEEFGISPRAVYGAKTKAMQVIKEYLEPLVMYFTNLDSQALTPIFAAQALRMLKAQKSVGEKISKTLENIRVSHSLSSEKCALALGISEDELIKTEQGKRAPSIADIKKYSSIFNIKITMDFEKGDASLIWEKR